MNKIYMCIDLKSFFASVECMERNLNPLTTNLVVADPNRTSKTICLAITPSLKQYGLGGRARLFEVNKLVREVNYQRSKENNYKKFRGKSYNDIELKKDKSLELDFIIAPPQMKKYMKYSTDIYNIYLKYISSEDILVYSIDEVFCDITGYLNTYKLTAEEFVSKIIKDVYTHTGITATAGIGTNMYLAKIAMDIVAKHTSPNEIGVRIAYLDEMLYRKLLWNHKPLTSFWRIGKGIAKKLENYSMHTMGDIARMSIQDENLLYKLFGINAELIIDHAWGYEPTTIKDAKSYVPTNNSISSGQVLHEAYNYEKTKLIVKEMIELLSLELVSRKVVTNRLVLTINYDVENLNNPKIKYDGEVVNDFYGRSVPKPAHGTINIDYKTSSTNVLTIKMIELYDKIINKNLLVRKVNMAACELEKESNVISNVVHKQLDLFSTNEDIEREKIIKESTISEKNLQEAILNIKSKYGKNAILKGMNLESGATTIQRNGQVGGHKG